LSARLREEEPPQPQRSRWWDRLIDGLTLRPSAGLWRPVGAAALVAIGFFGARLNIAGGGAYQSMGLAEPQTARVRYVEPAGDGRVQLVLDETRQRVISGSLDDQQIQVLLLGAARDAMDPGLRAESVELLNQRAQSAEVRGVLIDTLRHDQNAGVRWKALEGLKPFARQPEVRGALSQVLLSDGNPGLRTQAIDLLTGSEANVDREIIGTLQELMQRGESQDYVRERCLRTLQAMKASAEIY
jgi:hypothetical protein